MAQLATNADTYAVPRQNIFFKGVVPSLDGQCVSLVKYFMQDMSGVPNPQAPRGNAKDVGNNLVAQGHAVEVPYSQRKRGDIICYEFGQYGHISVQLSGGKVFEQNVKWPGVKSKLVAGAVVYASRIGSETEAWRVGKNAHIYRLKTYKEGSSSMTTKELHDIGTAAWRVGLHREPPTSAEAVRVGKKFQTSAGKLTPTSVIAGMSYIRGTLEWKGQHAKIKAPPVSGKYKPYSGAPLFVEDK